MIMGKNVMLPRKQLEHAGQQAEQASAFKAKASSGFDYAVSQVGKTASVTVYMANSIGGAVGGLTLAKKVLDRAEATFQKTQAFFGQIKLPDVNLLICPLSGNDDGSGGAYHYGCAGTELYCDDDLSDDGSTTLALFVAELSEVGQAAQNKGWDCGSSGGEALSRLHAESVFPGVLDDYSTAAAWLDSSRADWISQNEGTDQDAVSTGCGVLFLTWMMSRGKSLAQITQAPAEALSMTYNLLSLGTATGAYGDFLEACGEKWPVGKPSRVTTDNPWGSVPKPPPGPPTPPVPPPAPPPVPPVAPSSEVSTVTLSGNDAPGQYLLVPVATIKSLNAVLESLLAMKGK